MVTKKGCSDYSDGQVRIGNRRHRCVDCVKAGCRRRQRRNRYESAALQLFADPCAVAYAGRLRSLQIGLGWVHQGRARESGLSIYDRCDRLRVGKRVRFPVTLGWGNGDRRFIRRKSCRPAWNGQARDGHLIVATGNRDSNRSQMPNGDVQDG